MRRMMVGWCVEKGMPGLDHRGQKAQTRRPALIGGDGSVASYCQLLLLDYIAFLLNSLQSYRAWRDSSLLCNTAGSSRGLLGTVSNLQVYLSCVSCKKLFLLQIYILEMCFVFCMYACNLYLKDLLLLHKSALYLHQICLSQLKIVFQICLSRGSVYVSVSNRYAISKVCLSKPCLPQDM